MPNPALSDKALERQFPASHLRSGWAAPTQQQYGEPGAWSTPSGPLAPDTTDVMTVGGSTTATGVLLVILVAAGAVGWSLVEVVGRQAQLPGWIFVPFLGALAIGFATIFRPQWARITAPLYAATMGVAVGAISRVYDVAYEGIVVQAIGGTVAVLAIMLFLHATRIIKVTDRFRMVVVCATGAIFLVYMVNLVLHLFGSGVPFLHDSGPLGILISVAIVIVAALNLSLDFDFIERGVRARAPKRTEWYAAFGLLVTLVWLYLEMLRLLAKLRE